MIYKKLAEVSREIKSVSMANMQRYKARHIYDVYNMLQPILAKHGITIGRELVSERENKVVSSKGTEGTHRYQVWKFKFIDEEGSSHETTYAGESIDWGDKSSSQCDSMASKQMLIHTFLIPTKDLQEPDDKPEMENKSQGSTEDQEEMDWGEYAIRAGSNKGVKLKNMSDEEIQKDLDYWKGRNVKGVKAEDLAAARNYLADKAPASDR